MNRSRKLVQINPVVRISTSTGRIMQEIGQLATLHGWESYLAYGGGRDGRHLSGFEPHRLLPVGNKADAAVHLMTTRLFDRHGLASKETTRSFVRELEAIGPDIVHIHNIHGYFLNYPILFDYLRSSGVPVVWTVHDCWLYTGHCYYYSFAGCNRWQEGCHDCPQKKKFPASLVCDRSRGNYEDKKRIFTSLADGQLTIVPVSQWIRDEMSHSFLKDCNFRTIHNGIDTDVFKPYCNADEIRDRYGLGNRRIYMAAASIWIPEKGLEDIVRISEMLEPDELIVLVGADDKVRQKLPSQGIAAINRTADVHELAQLYSAASVFLNPTWQDNYPTVNMEAISCGTPVVTYRTGGSIETINDLTGRIVEQGDRAGMLAAARSLNPAPDDLRAFALANFRKEDRYQDYISLYDEIVK